MYGLYLSNIIYLIVNKCKTSLLNVKSLVYKVEEITFFLAVHVLFEHPIFYCIPYRLLAEGCLRKLEVKFTFAQNWYYDV
ncbi:MAG TPA: hypothetical protein DCO90_16080 [Sphingobacterium sp.]|nr:hypothetical protein [Sphingobacterium sp.]